MTLNNWAYSILNTVNPLLVDDEEVNIRQVKEWIIDYRATFLKNKLDEGKQLDYTISQTIPKLELKFIETSFDGSRIFRTKESLPDVISLKYKGAIMRIGPTDLTIPSYKISQDIKEVPFLGNGRFNGGQIFTYLNGSHIYVKTKDPLFPIQVNNELSVTAVFSNPRDLGKYRDSENKLVYSDEHTEFPLNREMKSYIDAQIIKEKFRITENSNPDKVNDGQDNSDRDPNQDRRYRR